MKFARTALAWVGGISVFAFMVLCLAVLPLFLPQRSWDPLAKRLARLLVACFGMQVRVRGIEQLSPDRAMILVCNHVNLIDGFLLYGHLPTFFRVLEQADHFSWPVWGWFSRRFGNICLDQGGGGRTAGALRNSGAALAAGISLLIFPEAHRTRDGDLLEFHRGAFTLARRNGVDLVPMVMTGAFEVFRTGSGGISPGIVELSILRPWTIERRTSLDDRGFRDGVRAEMVAAYAESRARLGLDSPARAATEEQ